ncbi:type IA DNA topoisomerase [Heliorestis convoluta]|uniref:DNA topoisomerase n=1 Tax=Heliorestis convoluta TaxID=356322 RepID=A0A5Q2MYC9_9FIRM|nr:type IA DNA topoisomerase [Heliorestis convoluta]QGG47738.1 DNA topoisomerase family protein Top [Heliorestis convoluta]
MILVIAEKPSAAREIGRVIAPNARKNSQGFLENENFVIAHARGHLVELQLPGEIDGKYKRWNLNNLPILPHTIPLKIRSSTAKEFKALKGLLLQRRFRYVVCATDAGREGQLIFDYIYELAQSSLPVKRLWLSTFTDEGIKKAWVAMKNYDEYSGLSKAARLRAQSDWIVGMNASPALSLCAGRKINVGRVMTPTLTVIAQRTEAHRNFHPEPYFLVKALFGNTYWGTLLAEDSDTIHRLQDKALGAAIIEKIEGQTGEVLWQDNKKEWQSAPPLFNLSDLQVTAAKAFGFTADKTLSLAQALYEKHKCLSYPRTSSRHLEPSLTAQLPSIIQVAEAIPELCTIARSILHAPLPRLSKKYMDSTKVTDHHGLIPTDKKVGLDRLTSDEKAIYLLVLRRFLAIFLPPAQYEKKEIITGLPQQEDDKFYRFRSRGKRLLSPGWLVLYEQGDNKTAKDDDSREKDGEESQNLPDVAVGDRYLVTKTSLEEKMTTAPPLFNDGTIIKAMQNIAEFIDDKALKGILKPLGLGTEATRAAILEKLIKLDMIERIGRGKVKQLVATDFGMQVVQAIRDESIKSPALTALWEDKLAQIEEGTLSEESYRQELNLYIHTLIDNLQKAKVVESSTTNSTAKIDNIAIKKNQGNTNEKGTLEKTSSEKNIGLCPLCQGEVIEGRKGFGCSNWKKGCTFVIWKEIAGKKLTMASLRKLLRDGKTGTLKGFRSKAGKTFSAALVLQNGKVEFLF